ncbi:hypothetical protein ALI22I_39495 [Saccharothrix sp. ALI-22-I]|uniref:hypothetical protein n=1 Tax=Saccharothrix sp. ALI-22-I TaxID=1933778 RepID=UPI00097C0F5E|nr:hypothetical protein [Saccharothrix sp. ALI-22-I]ONI82220.1 hypothetical protein ALI22I_39495 [Saccharothrix sp. ALI-22-I]
MTLNRDRVVAASLVGTVVVVLGFASGLGRVPIGAADQQAITHPPQSPDHVTGTTPPVPTVYVGQPQSQGQPNRNVVGQRPVPTHPNPVHPDPTHPGGGHPAPNPTTPPTTTPPAQQPPCDVDAIGGLLGRLGAVVEGLPLVSDLTGALPLLGGDGLGAVTGTLGGLTGAVGGLTGSLTGALGLLGGATSTPLTGPLAGVLPTGATGSLQPGTAVSGVGGLPDLAGVVGTATSTGALPIAGTNNAELNGLLGNGCGLLVQPGDGRIVGLLSTP